MKLYYAPGACSLASHIALRETGADFDLEKVDTGTGKTETGAAYAEVNPKGYVPALKLDDGTVLTEGAAILQFIADGAAANAPKLRLAPAAGSRDRVHLQEHLNYVASEIHKSFSPFFASEPPAKSDDDPAFAKLVKRLDYVEDLLSDGRTYLMGDEFTVADAYLFTVANWAHPLGIGLDRWPNLAAFVERISARPATRAAMQAEGLIQ